MPHDRDKRYKVVKVMIENGVVSEFKDIFDYIPKSIVANDLSTNYNRLIRLMDNVEEFTFEEIFRLAEFCEVDRLVLVKLLCRQYESEKILKTYEHE